MDNESDDRGNEKHDRKPPECAESTTNEQQPGTRRANGLSEAAWTAEVWVTDEGPLRSPTSQPMLLVLSNVELGVRFELVAAGRRTEVIALAPVFTPRGGGLEADRHATYWFYESLMFHSFMFHRGSPLFIIQNGVCSGVPRLQTQPAIQL